MTFDRPQRRGPRGNDIGFADEAASAPPRRSADLSHMAEEVGVIDIERALGGMVRRKKQQQRGVRGWEGSSGAGRGRLVWQSQSRGTAKGGVKRLPLGGGLGAGLWRDVRACDGPRWEGLQWPSRCVKVGSIASRAADWRWPRASQEGCSEARGVLASSFIGHVILSHKGPYRGEKVNGFCYHSMVPWVSVVRVTRAPFSGPALLGETRKNGRGRRPRSDPSRQGPLGPASRCPTRLRSSD